MTGVVLVNRIQLNRSKPRVLSNLLCDGLIGNGSGGPNGRDFYYHVVPGDDPVDRVDIGCDYNQLSLFTSVEVPNGWTFGVIDAGAHFIHDLKFTPHGRTTTVVNGTCEYKLRFTGPPLSTPFGLGFDFLGEPHEVHWKVTGGTQTDWTKRVGQGKGPIHSPGFQDGPVEQQPGESSDASHGHDHGHH